MFFNLVIKGAHLVSLLVTQVEEGTEKFMCWMSVAGADNYFSETIEGIHPP